MEAGLIFGSRERCYYGNGFREIFPEVQAETMDAIEREAASMCLLELPKLPLGVPEPLNSPSRAILKQPKGGSNTSSEDAQGSRHTNNSSCKRLILADYEKEATFHPKLNSHSLKIVAKSSGRSSASISNRIFEANKGHLQGHHEENPNPAAKPNTHGLRSTQDRLSRLAESQSKSIASDSKASSNQQCDYTFKPQVSERSMRIVESLGTSFLDRQLMHMERKQRLVSTCSTHKWVWGPSQSLHCDLLLLVSQNLFILCYFPLSPTCYVL